MSKPDIPNFSDLSPSKQIIILNEEIKKWQYADPNHTEILQMWLSDAYDLYQNELEIENEHMITEVDYDDGEGYDIEDYYNENKEYYQQQEEENEAENNKETIQTKLENSDDLKIHDRTAKQIDDIHKAFLGSIKPKEQSRTERVEQMTARILADGALKVRKGK